MLRKNKSEKSSRKNTNVSRLDMSLSAIIREQALRYLPAKTLFRSLSVCRDWKLQISTPFFVHNQSVSCRLFSGVFVQSAGTPPFFISLDQMAFGVPDQEFSFLPEPVDVKSSTNGLVCCVGRGSDRAYYVCNPVNRHWKKLPKPANDHGPDPAIALVFEPSVLSFMADFKVVCVFPSTDIDGAYEFDIYSSDRDSWKLSPEMYFLNSSDLYQNNRTQLTPGFQFGRAVYLEGVIYWVINSCKLVSYDMKTNKTTCSAVYPALGYSYGNMQSPCLGAMDGKICISSIRDLSISMGKMTGKQMNTMTTKGLLHRAPSSLDHMSRLNSEIVGPVGQYDRPQILAIWDGVVVVCVGNKFFSHDMKTQETRALLQSGQIIGDQVVVVPYVNSLVALE